VNLCPAAAVQKTAEAKRTRLGFLTEFSFKKFRVKHLDRVLICKKTQKTAKSELFFAALPQYIVFDEPTAMLDPRGRQEVIATMQKLNREEGLTIINITHFMDEAVQADRIVIMDNSQVLLDGTPAEIFAQEETLREVNLEVPMAVALAERLRKRGIKIPEDIITSEGLVEFICQYK